LIAAAEGLGASAQQARWAVYAGRYLRRLKPFSARYHYCDPERPAVFPDVLTLKNYNESILKSLSNGVVTLDQQLVIVR
jgi:adenylate cyclase